jgi:geranylgeranyl diphosphate synthase type I
MSQASAVISRVNEVLTTALDNERQIWTRIDDDLETVFDEIESLVLGGGKRLRPQFAHWGWVAAGGDPEGVQQFRIGAAIELLHVFALFHDDVIDDAETRRGNTTTHRRMADMHSAEQMAGESRRFGEGAAILIGDITYVMSDKLMDNVSPAARSIWHDLRMEMNIGQYLDSLGSARRERRIEIAERICRYKSAKYTIERPLHLGAVAANVEAGSALMPMLSAYGLPLGDAFQMRDDMLGAFGDSSLTGKPVGGDFLEGKPTPMLARAYAIASASQLKILDTIGTPGMSHDDVSAVQEVVSVTGAVAEMESLIVSLRDEAVTSLDAKQLRGDSYNALVELADAVTQRTI